VHFSPSDVINIGILTNLLPVFSTVSHGVLALLDYLIKGTSVIFSKLRIHVLVLFKISPDLR